MFDTEKFIEEIEKRPAIYDVNRCEYNDRNAKMRAWEEVCQVMVPNWWRLSDEERNIEEKSLRGKWRNIRDYFMKEFKLQLQKSLKPDLVRRKRKKYMYYDQLLFLMPIVMDKLRVTSTAASNVFPNTVQNQIKSEESEGEVDNPVIEESDVPLAHAVPSLTTEREYVQTNESFKMSPSAFPDTVRNQIKTEESEGEGDNLVIEESDVPLAHSVPSLTTGREGQRVTIDEEDYDKMFLLSLLPTMRRIPEEKKLDVQIQIQQVLASTLRPPDDK
ncbi:PREDICTED: uncharacterized protein LOC107068011 isoform X2 [Polistes dominula]|uniref:Uncharacterized protein LOC107068011 isoform X2 n=1 Tax=Polistes dominula TaxID=743375 RepID=A0ABM1IH00_POLDO|nr:PREDICTED: uncharacterized protein LOC107068011 isoform X2 [Polistes dominula]